MPASHIGVCLCTFRRPRLLRRLLERLSLQQTGNGTLAHSCVVVDNDDAHSAAEVVQEFQRSRKLAVTYESETARNFAVVRNRAVQSAQGDFIAFIDDDEIPGEDWLLRLLETVHHHDCDGALGPVRPYFETPAPRWLDRSGLCERPAHPTGMMLHWSQMRTGNALLRRDIFEPGGIWFDPAFRTGGEDVDFFKRAQAAGRRFVWCEEAPAYELVPPERMRLAYHLRRALLQGVISLKYELGRGRPVDRTLVGLKSATALIVYTLALPFLLCAGFHRFVRCLVKACHHLGRFSALCGLPIIQERKL
jgi:succinoglycan biosynthesis protein ExoM